MCERCFAQVHGCFRHPFANTPVQAYPALGMQQERFPCAYRRQPKLIAAVSQFVLHAGRKLARLRQAPEPNVRIEEQFQGFRASISAISMTGETTSPVISMLFDIEPNQSGCCVSGDAGTTSAMTLPRLVTRSVALVLSTSSNRERHFALNSEMAIDFLLLPGFMGLLRSSQFYNGHRE